ncbi:MAG: EAL domain-containing protein [Proteobacteria bacterium]|nr:EAL domain-containing protein [Pseudomonadota bacterium]
MDELPEIKRTSFSKILEREVGEARSVSSNLGLLLVDLSNLTRINHYHGYATGDRLLAATYKNLLSVSKLPDTVFRIGSHHYAFILSGLSNPAFIALAMNKIHRLLEQELSIDDDVAGVDLKIGVAINRQGQRGAMEMLSMAEASLAQVRRGEALQIEDLVSEEPDAPQDMQLEQLFTETLHENAFELYYQPKINLITGEANAAEALLRWEVEGRGFISPEIAVELADTTGRVYSLTKWVVHTAMRQVRAWQDSIDVSVALNVQADLVNSPDLLTLLKDAIAIWGVDPSKITVEITESAIIADKESGFDNLLQMKQLGINLAIDDFGTGYSSLSYFKHIPATELKIDQSFIRSMRTDPQDLELVKIIIHIAHQFGLSVVGEGVEDRESLELLRELGCDFAQGFYFSKPLPKDEFEAWVLAWPGL